MSIHRSRPESGFAQIPNEALRDPRLSYRARGVLAELLSRTDDWVTTPDRMSRNAKDERGEDGEGRDAMRAAFTELERAGYLYRDRRNGRGGRFVTEVRVLDASVPEPKAYFESERALAAAVDNSPSGDVSAGRTDDGTGSRRSELGEDAKPQVAPATGLPGAGGPGAGGPGAGLPGVITKTYDEDLKTETYDEDLNNEDQVGVLTSPVPVEGANGRSGQKRISDEEWAERERIVARQVGPLPGAAP